LRAAHGKDFVILFCIVLIQITSVTDRRTDGRTNRRTPRRWLRRAMHSAIARNIIFYFTGATERLNSSVYPRLVRTSEFPKRSNMWRSLSAVTKVLYTHTEIRAISILHSSVGRVAKRDLQL